MTGRAVIMRCNAPAVRRANDESPVYLPGVHFDVLDITVDRMVVDPDS